MNLEDLESAMKRLRGLSEIHNMVTLNKAEVHALLDALEGKTDSAPAEPPKLLPDVLENYRREKPGLDAIPLPNSQYDYSRAGTLIDKAIHHLDEGLPNGQKKRCAIAFNMLEVGVYELKQYMLAKGYFAPDAAA